MLPTQSDKEPLNVYKAILKMALSVLDEQDLNYYRFAFEYLITHKHDNNYSGFGIVTTYSMPLTFQYQQPTGMLFKKICSSDKLFTHVFLLFALNSIFQIVLPFNRRDTSFYQSTGSIDILWCPPFFGSDVKEIIKHIITTSYNLNSTKQLYNQKESFIIPTQPGEYDKSRFLNKETGEIYEKAFDGSKIIGIELLRIDKPLE